MMVVCAVRIVKGLRKSSLVPLLFLGGLLAAGCDPLVTIEGSVVDERGAPLDSCRIWHVEDGYEYEVISGPGRLNDDMLPPMKEARFHYRINCGFDYRVRETREVTGAEIYDSDYEINLGDIVIERAE